MLLGVLFNILVCYIYRCRSRRATSNFFVIFFAIFDIVGCCIGIPLEICALCLPYIFNADPLCRIIGFVETFSVCSLCLMLICVSYDCYRKHCRPSEIYGVKKARNSCIVAIVIAFVLSLPAFVVFRTHKRTITPQIYGWACSIDVTLPMWLRYFYYIIVLLTFTVSLIVMTILYCTIGVNFFKQKQAEERGEKPNSTKRSFPKKHRFVKEETSTSSTTTYAEEITRLQHQGTTTSSHSSSHSHHSSHTDPVRFPLKGSSSNLAKDSTRPANKGSTAIVKTNSLQASSPPPSTLVVQLHVKSLRQTSIFLVIFIAFVATMLPYVVITVLCMTTQVFHTFSSSATEIVFNLCVRSYLFNYIWKPVVYLIFNINFRKEVKQMFCRLWKMCTFSNAELPQNSRQLKRSFTMGSSRSTSRVPIYRPPKHSV